MADEVDNTIQIDVNEIVLNNKQPVSESLLYCDYCGEDIPEIRRKLGSVKYCVECQSLKEKGRL